MSTADEGFMREAVALARANIKAGGRPFGAVLVRAGQVLARGVNEIHLTHDLTAHAELLAIRRASEALGTPDLRGAVMYASGHPCPMCLSAMLLCGIESGFFAYSNEDGAPFGLSTAGVYARLGSGAEATSQVLRPLRPAGEGGLYEAWEQSRRSS